MENRNEITEGLIWKQLLIFFLPILLGSAFQQLYNTADTVIVGKFVGTESLAAVGATGTLIGLLVNFFVGLAGGATVIIAQYYGGKNEKELSLAVHTATAMTIYMGLFLTVFGILAAPFLLRLINVPADIIHLSIIYIRIYFLGMVPAIFYNVGAGILRAIGDSKRPLYFLIVSTLTNIILDIIFVVILKMGVAGVGLATTLCQYISAALVLLVLTKTNETYHLNIQKIRIEFKTLKAIIKIGLPTGLQSVLYGISNLTIQSSINMLGTSTIAAWSAFGKIDGLFWMMIGAFGVSITTFVGQNFGAGKYDRIKQSVKVCAGMALIGSFSLSLLFFIFGPAILSLFTNDNEVIEIGIQMIHTMSPYYFTFVGVEVLSGAIRGVGEAFIPMVITCFGVCGLRIAWMLIIVPLAPTLNTIAMCYPFTWCAASLMFILYYFKGNWLNKRIDKKLA